MRIHLVSLILVAYAQASHDNEATEAHDEHEEQTMIDVEITPGVFEEIPAGDKIPPTIEVTVHAEEDHDDENDEAEIEEPQEEIP